MSPSDQSESQLTRKQLRELRMTGATPIVTPDANPSVAEIPQDSVAAPVASAAPLAPEVQLPRAAEALADATPPPADGDVDLDVAPRTRRQAREQERIRTASVPVIVPPSDEASSPEPEAEAPAASRPWWKPKSQAEPTVVEAAPVVVDVPSFATAEAPGSSDADSVPAAAEAEAVAPAADLAASDAVVADVAEADVAAIDAAEADAVEVVDASAATGDVVAGVADATSEITDDVELAGVEVAADAPIEADAAPAEAVAVVVEDAPVETRDEETQPGAADSPEALVKPLLQPSFGGGVGAPESAALPPSFDDLIARNTSTAGSSSTANALIVPQAPSIASLTAPVTATGEVLITGTFALPDGLGSQGHAPGVADGKDVDAVLIDGELPAASSPTPIAASAAVSQVKAPGEIIRPPAPEKTNKLMVILAITAGVLAVSVIGVVVYAATSGVFG